MSNVWVLMFVNGTNGDVTCVGVGSTRSTAMALAEELVRRSSSDIDVWWKDDDAENEYGLIPRLLFRGAQNQLHAIWLVPETMDALDCDAVNTFEEFGL